MKTNESINKTLFNASLGIDDTPPLVSNPLFNDLQADILANSLKDISLTAHSSLLTEGLQPEVHVLKPDGSNTQVQDDPTGDYQSQLCEVHNIPLGRSEPLRVYHKIDIKLKELSFYGDKILDNNARIDLRGTDLTKALSDYADKYGERRHFYSRIVSNFNEAFIQDGAQWMEDIQEALINQGLYLLMYHDGHFLFTSNQPSAFVRFREKALGWSQGAVGDSNLGSTYPPEEVDNILKSSSDVLELLKGGLLLSVYVKKQQAEQKLQEINANFQEQPVELIKLGTDLQLVNSMLEKIEGHATLNENKHIVYYAAKSGSSTAEVVIKKTSSFDREDISGIALNGVTDENYEQLLVNLINIKQRFDEIERVFGSFWNVLGAQVVYSEQPNVKYRVKHFKVFADLVAVLRKMRDYIRAKVNEDSREFFAQYESELNEVNHELAIYRTGENLINTGVIIEGTISKLSQTLSSNHVMRKVVLDTLVPLLLSRSEGAYSEAGQNEYQLLPPPESRLFGLLNYAPEVGLITEYNMEIQHLRFGIGRHLHSQSLFPGEEVSIEMSSQTKKEIEITTNKGEKIFEDAMAETSTDFNKELNNEFNKTTDSSKKSAFSASASLSASGFGATVSGSISKNSESSHAVNEAAKNVAQTTDKLAKKLSDQRQVTFDTTTSEKIFTTEETTNKSTRKFVNINKERTLTFNFFQVTREYRSRLMLDDVLFYYTSGKYRVATLFVPSNIKELTEEYINSQAATNSGFLALQGILQSFNREGVTLRMLLQMKVIRIIPGEVADQFPSDAVIILYSPPYQEIIPLSATNAFLAKTFDKEINAVQDINHYIWKFLGGGSISPDGIGVLAFPEPEGELDEWPKTSNAASPKTEIFDFPKKVVADKITITRPDKSKYNYLLANIDLCYGKVRHFRSRYVSDKDRNKLPLTAFQKNYVINTDGVYCENMLGRCGALEQFATDHRRYDVEAKILANRQAELLLPPDINAFIKTDGSIDFDQYTQAVKQYEIFVRALRDTPASNTESTN